MKVFLKTEDEIKLMREANQLASMTLVELAKRIKPEINKLLDQVAEEFIHDQGGMPTLNNFPILWDYLLLQPFLTL